MKQRPNLNLAVKALLRDISQRMPEFAHIKPARVLVVAGEARRASRGTVKPLSFEGTKLRDKSGRRKPEVRLNGRRMLYCITLRPLFFRSSTVQARLATLIHELFHISPKFDGTLAEGRRHAKLGKEFAARLRPLVKRYLTECPAELKAPFAHDGEVRILQWLERPGAVYQPDRGTARRVYTEEQLYQGVVRMITPRSARVSKEDFEGH